MVLAGQIRIWGKVNQSMLVVWGVLWAGHCLEAYLNPDGIGLEAHCIPNVTHVLPMVNASIGICFRLVIINWCVSADCSATCSSLLIGRALNPGGKQAWTNRICLCCNWLRKCQLRRACQKGSASHLRHQHFVPC